MGNSFGADESYKRHRRSENYRHNRRKLSAEIPQEPTVHGLSFLPDNQKSKWREQTKRRLRISFRRRSLDAESKSPNEDVPTMNGDPLLGTNQCEIISCDMDNRSAQSTPSIQSMDQPSEYSVKDLDQHYFPYQNLILSGGGSKGYAYLGAIKVSGWPLLDPLILLTSPCPPAMGAEGGEGAVFVFLLRLHELVIISFFLAATFEITQKSPAISKGQIILWICFTSSSGPSYFKLHSILPSPSVWFLCDPSVTSPIVLSTALVHFILMVSWASSTDLSGQMHPGDVTVCCLDELYSSGHF